jgi:uncharacterized membrane protein YkoI
VTDRLKKLLMAVLALAALAAGGAGIAAATGGGDDGGASAAQRERGDDEGDQAPPTADAARATRAALAQTGGGHANAVELDGEDGATYEVEVTRPGGSTVDVRLDRAFRVVKVEADAED